MTREAEEGSGPKEPGEGTKGERSAWDTEARKIINVVGIRVVVDVFSLCVHARNPDGKPAQ